MSDDILLKMRGVKIDGKTGDDWLPIIKGIDLDLRRGEVLGLIGESGAGKSTLLKIAAGLVQHDHGERFGVGGIRNLERAMPSHDAEQNLALEYDRVERTEQDVCAASNWPLVEVHQVPLTAEHKGDMTPRNCGHIRHGLNSKTSLDLVQ